MTGERRVMSDKNQLTKKVLEAEEDAQPPEINLILITLAPSHICICSMMILCL